jgi:guanine deaminase
MLPNFQTTEGDHSCPFPLIAYHLIILNRGQQYQLLDWLENITFPTESAFKDPEYAKAVYPGVINTTIQHGVMYLSFAEVQSLPI